MLLSSQNVLQLYLLPLLDIILTQIYRIQLKASNIHLKFIRFISLYAQRSDNLDRIAHCQETFL